MKIHQHIYTKVRAEQSPHGKNGFQSLYYPITFLEKKNILNIESVIHFNGTEGLRRSVFFEKIAEVFHLVVSYMVPLPEIKDEFGRSGMFLVHSFIIPPDIWKHLTSPLSLSDFLDSKYIQDFHSIEKYPGINKETGDLAPIEYTKEIPSKPITQLTVNEKKLYNVLYRIALRESNSLALAIQGKPADVDKILDRLVTRLPKALWPKIGWHTAFDEGKIFFYPLKIVGFEKSKPITGDPITYILDNNAFEAGQEALTQPTSTFQNWVLTSTFNEASSEIIEQIYELSEFLEDRMDVPQQPYLLDSFLKANEQELVRLLGVKLKPIVGEDWANLISAHDTPTGFNFHQETGWILRVKEAVELMLESMNKTSIAQLLERTVLEKKIDLRKNPIPNVLLPFITPTIRFLLNIPDKPNYSLITDLSRQKQAQIIMYLNEFKFEPNTWELWLNCPEAAITSLKVIELFKAYIAKESSAPEKIAPLLAETIFREKRFSECLQRNWQWATIIDSTLANQAWSLDLFPIIKQWAEEKGAKDSRLPWLECVVYGEKPSRIILDQAAKSVIICWIKYLKKQPEEIIEKGFEESMVKSLYKEYAPGWLNQIKRFFHI